MPETSNSGILRYADLGRTQPGSQSDYARVISMLSRQAREAKEAASSFTAARDRFIRDAHAGGETFHTLAQWSDLSRAQVQRICDLSKGGNDA